MPAEVPNCAKEEPPKQNMAAAIASATKIVSVTFIQLMIEYF